MIVLDREKIIPTDYPRKAASMDLARAQKLEDINFGGVEMDDMGDGNLYVYQGHHRIGRALEIAPGQVVEVEVKEANEQTKLDIKGALRQFEQNGEIRNYDEYIERTKWLRGDK